MGGVSIDFSDLEEEINDSLPSAPSPRRSSKILKRTKPLPLSSVIKAGVPILLSQVVIQDDHDQELEDLINLPLVQPILQNYEKIQKKIDPLTKEINMLRRYRRNPLLFWRDELGVPIDRWRDDKPPKSWRPGDPLPLWSKQREIIEALVKHRKVAVKSGHGVGKTFLAGGLSLYLAYVWHCIGLTTAPTFRQVRRALWGEIHYLFNNAINPLGGKLNQVSLDLGDKWFVEGFATDKPMENITGIHEENIFVIIDEAGGVVDLTFEAIEGLLTSENSFVLYIGNPINSEGPFADAFKPNSPFYKVTVSCYDLPNIKYGNNFYTKLTSHQWVKDKETKWGKDSNMFKIKVLGEFPEEGKDTLIPIRYIEAALQRAKDGSMPPDCVVAFGLDVARQGSDASVFGALYASGLLRILETTNKKRETETAGLMEVLYKQYAPSKEEGQPKPIENEEGILEALSKIGREEGDKWEEKKKEELVNFRPPVNVDDTGLGGGVTDILIEQGLPVNGIITGEAPDENDERIDHPELFLNKRAQYYWYLRTRFVDGTIAIEDEELAFELSKIRIEFLKGGGGKIKIVDKETLKKAPPIGIGRSPDRADMAMLACSKEVAESDGEMVRFLG